MRARLLLVLAAGAFALAPAMAGATANRCNMSASPATTTMAAIGDSMSVANDAWDDGCKTLQDFLGRLGNDWQSSWAVGDLPGVKYSTGYSVKKMLGMVNSRTINVLFPRGGTGLDDGCGNRALYDTDGNVGSEVVGCVGGISKISEAFTNPIIAPRNGSAWDDGPAQAQAIKNHCTSYPAQCPHVITIQLGGNDVCSKDCASVTPQATAKAYIDQTINILKTLPAGTEVWVNSMPNLAAYRLATMNKRNWVFRNCQALWNLDLSELDIVQCDNGILGSICNMAARVVEITGSFIDFLGFDLQGLFGVNFPCASVLQTKPVNYASTCAATTQGLNTAINNYYVTKFCSGGADNATACAAGVTFGTSVKFYLGRSLKSFPLTDKHVNTLDCFHPCRMGQEVMAMNMWKDLCDAGINAPVACSGPSPDATNPGSAYYVYDTANCPAGGLYAGYCTKFQLSSSCVRSRVRLFIRKNSTTDWHDYGGTYFKESQQFGDNHLVYFHPPTGGAYYQLFYEIMDEAYLTSGSAALAVPGRKFPADAQDANTHVWLYHNPPQQVGGGALLMY